MRVIPAIDLKGGKCVRLLRGDFERQTEYSNDPADIARRFAEFAVRDLHVVDLDGARTGAQANTDTIRRIANETPFELQLGGGIRSRRTLEHWFENGAARGVIGSLAVSQPPTVRDWLEDFGPDRIVLALDVTMSTDGTPLLAMHGWTTATDVSLWDCIDDYASIGLRHVLCTDISRDGALSGPNVDLYAEILTRYPGLQLQASGGVRNAQDLSALEAVGVPATITGRALLDGRITAAEVATFQRSA